MAGGSTGTPNSDEVLSTTKALRANRVLKINPQVNAQGQNNRLSQQLCQRWVKLPVMPLGAPHAPHTSGSGVKAWKHSAPGAAFHSNSFRYSLSRARVQDRQRLFLTRLRLVFQHYFFLLWTTKTTADGGSQLLSPFTALISGCFCKSDSQRDFAILVLVAHQ